MRKINHIILDFENQFNNFIPNYWVISFTNKQKLNKSKIVPLDIFIKKQNAPTFLNYLNINFLRKEFLYTKLKYSRSPAYDIVSGGAAVIFAGFLGFLVSEKFGLELVDSGDFYFLIMYIVFLAFSIRPILTSLTPEKSFLSIFNPKYILRFYTNIIFLFFKR